MIPQISLKIEKKLLQIIIVILKNRSLNRFIRLHGQNAGISETIAYLVGHLLGQGTGHCQVVQGADGLDKKHRGYALSSTFWLRVIVSLKWC